MDTQERLKIIEFFPFLSTVNCQEIFSEIIANISTSEQFGQPCEEQGFVDDRPGNGAHRNVYLKTSWNQWGNEG